MSGIEGIHISDMRQPYKGEEDLFDEGQLVAKEPFGQFSDWLNIACKTDGIMEANAMSLATATKDGKPSVRTVLLKGFDENGFKFYTNYESRKGRELESNPNAALVFYWSNYSGGGKCWSRQAENPYASLLFYWEPLMQMVRIEGKVEKLSEEESTAYFHSRPRPSQIGALVSQQSTVLASRQVLSDRNEELKRKFADESKPVPKPDYWGGYLVRPDLVEFWQGQTNRLHDRIVFRRPDADEKIDPKVTHEGEQGWVYERLSS